MIRIAVILVVACALSQVSAQSWTNATSASGLAYPAPYAYTGFGRGVAFADFDGDGDVDCFAPEGAGGLIRLWRNQGGGTYTPQTLAPPIASNTSTLARADHGVAAADIDNDGDADAFVCQGRNILNQPLTNLLFINQGLTAGNVGFTEEANLRGVAQTIAGDSYCCSFGDYDRDGQLDLVVGDYHPPLTSQASCTSGLAAAPLCYVAPHTLFRNAGNGMFTDVTAAAGVAAPSAALAVFWHDYDGDGWPDLLYVNDHGIFVPNALFRNNRNGTFADVSVATGTNIAVDGMGITAGDTDNDGDWDLFVTNQPVGQAFLKWNAALGRYDWPGGSFLSNGTTYGFSTGQTAWGCHFFDYDADGRLDLFVMEQTLPNRMFRNTGAAPWTDVTGTLFGGATPSTNIMPWGASAAIIDDDDDGDLDIFIPSEATAGQLIRNPGGTNHWLKLVLHGTTSNRDAIGTTVIATSASGVRRRRVISAEGYLSDGDKRIHFGLGADTTVSQIEFRWPSGTVSYAANVAVDQALTVTEPAFQITGPMTPGSVNTVALSLPSDGGLPYVTGLSLDASAEFYLPDLRAIRVNVFDPLLLASTTWGNPLWGAFIGTMTAPGGTATMALSIPPIPALTGFRAWMIGVTIDLAFPGSIKSIVGPQPFIVH